MTSPGDHISHYEILEKLGEGGMGVVFKAKDLKLDRTVALKFLPPQEKVAETDSLRFEQEAKALSALNHPNIATIFDIDDSTGQPFITLEYLPGGTLREKLSKLRSEGKDLTEQDIIEYAVQLASALAHAHKNSVIHRDIKSENIMLSADGTVKITDFGLARLGQHRTVTKTGKMVGTAAYMSPEQVRGEAIDHRSDIFSLGVVLYEMTTGHLPFEGDHEPAVMYHILNKDVSDSYAWGTVPPSLRHVILRCLEKEKTRRYQNCDDLLKDVRIIRNSTAGYTGEDHPHRPRNTMVVRLALALPALGALGLLVVFVILPMTTEPVAVPPSVAVLYTENMTGDESYGTFAAGMTEEIINELANLPGVQVLSRTDVQQYRGTIVDVQKVGEALGVSYILESSLRAEGNTIRFTCQAIQTSDRFHFWSHAYTRAMTGAFDVQSDIARQVALGLKARFAEKALEEQLGLPPHSLKKQEDRQ